MSVSNSADSECDTRRTAVQEAFLAGFMASGEGWNGEHPFEGVAPDIVWAEISDAYDEYRVR